MSEVSKLAASRRTFAALLVVALGLAAGCTNPPTAAPFKGAELSATPLLGKFVWRDLVSENPDAVKPFYAALFGWEFEEGRALGAPYTLVKSGGQFIAGISKTRRLQPEQPVSQWLSFMSVADVDRAVEQTRTAGGSVVAGPMDLPNIGRGAVVLDPDGAPLGLLRSNIGDPADTDAPAMNRFLWTEHLSRDPQASADFYASLAGFEVRKIDFGGKPYWVLLKGRERAGLLRNPISVDRPVWLAYVRVADPAASAARAAQLGGRVLLAPRADLRNGTLALIADPTGAVLALQKWPL
jgi:predicted enzyme related to lactoylglutathione lyase